MKPAHTLVLATVLSCLFATPLAHAQAQTVYLIGDSTMAPNTGYGDALCQRLKPTLDCVNLGRGGRSTLSYRAEGLWDALLARLRSAPNTNASTHVLIQFGHNDQPGRPGRSTELATEYPANLKRYVADVRAAGATPVLVTPLARRSFEAGRLTDQLAPWSDAMLEVARTERVPLLRLHALSMAAVQLLGQAGADELAETAPGQRRFDRTHLGARGACVFADILSRELSLQVPALATARSAAPDCSALLPPAQRFSAGAADMPGWAQTTGGRGGQGGLSASSASSTSSAPGGQGGQILRVTSLAASGPGSLKHAIGTPGPRTIVFEVGGVIDMAGAALEIRHPHLTIAGQTAPSPGISIIKAETLVRTHDVILQHLRFRPGEFGRPKKGGGDQDGLSTTGGARDVIVDHCSFSWGTDENLSASGPRFTGETPEDWRRGTSHRITFSHNLIYEGLSNSVHDKGEHSKGSLIHDNTSQVLIYGNVYASNRERNALFKGGAQGAMVNNLIFNPGKRAVHYNLWPQEWTGKPWQPGRLALVGNVLRYGPDTEPGTAFFTLRGAGELQLHLHDNLAWDASGRPVPMVDDQSQGQASWQAQAQARVPDHLPAGLRIRPAAQLAAELIGAVGARPWDRDALDQRVLTQMQAGQGRIIDSETANPLGYPTTPEPSRRRFDPEAWNLDDMSPKAGWASLFNPLPATVPLPRKNDAAAR